MAKSMIPSFLIRGLFTSAARHNRFKQTMISSRDEALIVNPRMIYPSSNFWLFFTVEFLIGALLSAFLAVLVLLKSLLPKPPRDLTGDVVVVAGASSSLGKSLAEEFAKKGCTVVCMDSDSRSIQETACRLKATRPSVEEITPRHRKDDSSRHESMIYAYQCDLIDRNDIRRTAERIKEDIGRVDILVTCVGNPNQDIFDATSRTLMSHFWTAMAFVPLMLYRERAHIVGVTPVASSQDAFHGSRAAIVSLKESLCQELGNFNSQLTFLAFTPIVESSTWKESEEQVARNIVRAVRTDQNTLSTGWVSRFLYQISCAIYYGITLVTQWIHSQGCDYST
ncbi:short-chain dehydrogenase/reductase family 16C member 6-like isoform X1 [Osmia bicornis bicornis]|uniref:short-chain dehydrogenase/reductase family 16C member 6-like isoform X1 n=1 Tax=Osmia bicornis bicornis TaxID=1437191 RepID=UPI001EAE94A8|nr:short-chain dehydrogenase/reductase family 16C member 6-like isoform X1 [Osmia bicornis bicornis]XP_029041506.2 short-chain dehydrogenase/reductase family 16C member 6-like isoform X1 [Osmia bicornis bicornis]XP_029041508.2 short-chain dehydrogenase/reductase family 16C member 6-like isoform X1 [Osmia bicornis bicornis]XP_029041509.2 short-chain dehydrogenase/reductase family 16C member 6-like isoform X1 [Osmia bicornis bicornis]